jgi:hypothetical protein
VKRIENGKMSRKAPFRRFSNVHVMISSSLTAFRNSSGELLVRKMASPRRVIFALPHTFLFPFGRASPLKYVKYLVRSRGASQIRLIILRRSISQGKVGAANYH